MTAWTATDAELAAIAARPSTLARYLRADDGSPLRLDDWQVETVDSEARALLLLAFRQSGKSTGISVRALASALVEPRLTLVVSPTDRQSGLLLDKVKLFHAQLGRRFGRLERDTATEIVTATGGRVVSVPGSNPDMIRGYSSVRTLVIDEAARTSDELYQAVLPMLAEDGQVVCPTTPAGRSGWFHAAWHSESGDWRRIRVEPGMSPRMTEERLQAQRRRMNASAFSVEYLLSFGASERSVYSADMIDAMRDDGAGVLDFPWKAFA